MDFIGGQSIWRIMTRYQEVEKIDQNILDIHQGVQEIPWSLLTHKGGIS